MSGLAANAGPLFPLDEAAGVVPVDAYDSWLVAGGPEGDGLRRGGGAAPLSLLPTEAMLATVGVDFAPALGEDAPAVVLGPWADVLSLGQPAHARARRNAVAAAAFAVPPAFDRSLVRAWCRQNPRPDDDLRDAVHAVGLAPCAPWRLVDETARGWTLAPVMATEAGWVPDGPVPLDEVGWVDDGPRAGGLLMGRVVCTSSGWRVFAGLVLPEVPPLAWWEGVYRRHALLVLRQRGPVARDDVLARVGHLLVGEAHRWWWSHHGLYR